MLNRLNQKPTFALAALALLFALAAGLAVGEPSEAKRKGKKKLATAQPNIVLIMTDDQAFNSYSPDVMPETFERIVDPGTSFSDYIITTPLCCPSRATTITGQYGHNNGVLKNDYALLRDKENVLPVWLQRAGYNTAHIGKFMNAYERFPENPRVVAPGWDYWFTQLEKRAFYNWKASKNGKLKRYGTKDRDHLTVVTNRQATRWTKKMAASDDPFYLQLDYYAPHGARGRDNACASGPVPAPIDEGRFANAPLPKPPNYNEADVSDKPSFIQERPPISVEEEANITRRYRCVIESMRGVDRGIGEVMDEVEEAGEMEQTIFIFTSDNGYYFGEHRIPKGKLHGYEENVHMPIAWRVPAAYRDGARAEPVRDDPIANLDLAPTILDYAGATPCPEVGECRTMDGRSLRSVLAGNESLSQERAFVMELFDCSYRAVRKLDNVYFEHGRGPIPTTGECAPTETEHYDLTDDPFQLQNLFPASRRSDDGHTQRDLEAELDLLVRCEGIEGRDPAPASGVYCD